MFIVVAVLREFRYISFIFIIRHLVETSVMRKKLMVFILSTLPLVITGCGDNGGAASGKWVGEVFESSNMKTSTVIGEFD